jgi:hypothetical protein
MGTTAQAPWRYQGRSEREQPAIRVLAGETGTARDLTDEITSWLEERHIGYERVPGDQLADRSLPLPTVIAWFESEHRDVAFRGYGRIVADFLPRFEPVIAS